jgi:hypothetical protein
LKKHGVLGAPWQEWLLRAYYGARGLLQPLRRWAETLRRRG